MRDEQRLDAFSLQMVQRLPHFFQAGCVEDLARRAVEIDVVVPVLVRMPLVAQKGDQTPRLMVGLDDLVNVRPGIARFLEASLVIVHQGCQPALPGRDIGPVGVDGDGGKIQLQPSILKSILQTAMSITHGAVAMEIAIVGSESLIDAQPVEIQATEPPAPS